MTHRRVRIVIPWYVAPLCYVLRIQCEVLLWLAGLTCTARECLLKRAAKAVPE